MFTRRIPFFVVATGLGVASPAMADWQAIMNYNSGLCLGVTAGVMQPGQPIIQWPCNGAPDQSWTVPASGGNQIQIQNLKDSSYCLSVNDYNEGSQLVIEHCIQQGSAPPGTFWLVSGPINGETYDGQVLSSDMTGYVAAVSGASTAEGTGIIQWVDQITGPYSHIEQQWLFEPTSVTFNMYAWTSIQGNGNAATLTGKINLSINGNWSISGGEYTAYDLTGDPSHFTASCSEGNISGWPSWSSDVGGNFVQDPTEHLTGSGNDSYFTEDWPAIASAWQSSGGQASCTLTAYDVCSHGGC